LEEAEKGQVYFPKGQAVFKPGHLYGDNGMSRRAVADIIHKYQSFFHEIHEFNTNKFQI